MNRDIPFISAVIIFAVLTVFITGCVSQEKPVTVSPKEIPLENNVTMPYPTAVNTPVVNITTLQVNKSISCGSEIPMGVINPIRTEGPFTGQHTRDESDINLAVKEFGPDLKIPAFVPDGFFFSRVSILDSKDDGKVSLVFVNNSFAGFYGNMSDANQIDIAFTRHADLQFREFYGLASKPICVNGSWGLYYASPSWNSVRWIDGDIERWVMGEFEKDTLIRIAESLKSPSELNLTKDVYSGNHTWPKQTIPPGITFPSTPKSP